MLIVVGPGMILYDWPRLGARTRYAQPTQDECAKSRTRAYWVALFTTSEHNQPVSGSSSDLGPDFIDSVTNDVSEDLPAKPRSAYTSVRSIKAWQYVARGHRPTKHSQPAFKYMCGTEDYVRGASSQYDRFRRNFKAKSCRGVCRHEVHLGALENIG